MIRRLEPALLLLWAMVTAALVFADFGHWARTLFALIFLGFVPGLAIIRLMRFEDYATSLLLAVPTSLGLAAAVSAVLVYSGVPSWDLGLSILLAITVGAVALDLARPAIFAQRDARVPRTKLDDESRQARLIQALLDGGTLPQAAQAAGVSFATLQRSLQRSERLRMAVTVAAQSHLDAAGGDMPPASSVSDKPRS